MAFCFPDILFWVDETQKPPDRETEQEDYKYVLFVANILKERFKDCRILAHFYLLQKRKSLF